MRAIIQPGKITGAIAAPPSKSMTQRAYAAALLHKGQTTIRFAGTSDDEKAALSIATALGAEMIASAANAVTLVSSGVIARATKINCGESGLCARLFAPIAALSGTPVTITGGGTLASRPMTGFKEAFSALGVNIGDFNGYLPLTLPGGMRARTISIDASAGSQLLSGLLFALSYAPIETITIHVKGLTSKPYIDMTLEILRHFGKPIVNHDYREFVIAPAQFTQQDDVLVDVEGDWSGAANLLVAGAIAGDVTVTNLLETSVQADRAIAGILRKAGANVIITDNTIQVRAAKLSAFDFDATHCPDLFPILAILAASCNGESSITGVHRLFHKESNRAESISEMLLNFDVPFSIEDNAFCITGTDRLQGTVIDSFSDHRIAMAAAVGALRASSQVDILGAEAVNKSYPAFFDHLSLCGVRNMLTGDS